MVSTISKGLTAGLLAIALGAGLTASRGHAATLDGLAVLTADTFAVGPTSGQFIEPANGRVPPFVRRQPVQGFSSVLRAREGEYLVMSDNGFGAKANSGDYVLTVYQISPDFMTSARGTGTIGVKVFFRLRDPDHKIGFEIVADRATYPGSAISVDPAIRRGRLLTGGDFDIESFRQAPDGTFWFGDEFGPFLLHTDATGRVLGPPIPLPGVQSPDNPFLGSATPNLPRSRGFEGMVITPNGTFLYPMLEGSLTTDPDQRRLIINQFDLRRRVYTGRQWFYRLEATTGSGQAIGDLTAVNNRAFLVIERDGGQGPTAQFKKIFLIDLDRVGPDGFLVKREVADLLNLADPDDIGGSGTGTFAFPFTTIESVIPLSARTIGVLNDNNYPFSSGRLPGEPDNNEFIVIRLNRSLPFEITSIVRIACSPSTFPCPEHGDPSVAIARETRRELTRHCHIPPGRPRRARAVAVTSLPKVRHVAKSLSSAIG
jgi:hypothetical protein